MTRKSAKKGHPPGNCYVALRNASEISGRPRRIFAKDALRATLRAHKRYGEDFSVMPLRAWEQLLKRGGALQHGVRMEKATEEAA